MSCRRQETFVKAVFAAYLEGNVSQLAEGIQKIPTGKKFAPLQVSVATTVVADTRLNCVAVWCPNSAEERGGSVRRCCHSTA